MKSLDTLIKLQKTYVDEQRIHLARLQDLLAAIENRMTQHALEMAREQIAAADSEECRATYGAFLQAAVAKARALEKERETAIAAVEIARSKLAQLFEEQKRYEIAERLRVEAALAEENRRERVDLDEISSVQFSRKNKE